MLLMLVFIASGRINLIKSNQVSNAEGITEPWEALQSISPQNSHA